MSEANLKDLSKTYQDQIAEKKKEDSYLEPDMKKRQKNNEKARKDMEKMGTSMKNPHFEEKQQGWDAVNSLADAFKGMQEEGYGAPGHNPGSGEKSVARAKALMDKQGRKGAPGLDAMAAAKKEHEARRGVKKEEVEVINKADSTIFQTERQLKEYGDKLPEDKKQPIEDALAELKKEFEAKNIENLEPAMEKLNNVFQAASQEMYNAANAEGANPAGDAGAQEGGASENPQDEVTDVDFEEVSDKK